MFMVVILHFVGHNALRADGDFHIEESNWISANLLESLSVSAVDCFVLISGYFSIKFRLRKIVQFLLPICFYEACISLVYYEYYHDFSYSPFNYWFVKPYFLLMLISPLLNEGLRQLGGAKILYYIAIVIGLSYWECTPVAENAGKNFTMFIMLYSIGYVLRFYSKARKSNVFWMIFFLGAALIIFIQTMVLYYMGHYQGSRTASFDYNSIFVIASAVSLFMVFSNLKLGRSKLVNKVAGSAFFVYIISENRFMYAHPYGMYDLLHVQYWQESIWYPIYILLASIGVFIACIFVDQVRIVVLRPLERVICGLCDRVENVALYYITKSIKN